MGELNKEDLPPGAQKVLEEYLLILKNAGFPPAELEINQEWLIPDRHIEGEEEIVLYIRAAWGSLASVPREWDTSSDPIFVALPPF